MIRVRPNKSKQQVHRWSQIVKCKSVALQLPQHGMEATSKEITFTFLPIFCLINCSTVDACVVKLWQIYRLVWVECSNNWNKYFTVVLKDAECEGLGTCYARTLFFINSPLPVHGNMQGFKIVFLFIYMTLIKDVWKGAKKTASVYLTKISRERT